MKRHRIDNIAVTEHDGFLEGPSGSGALAASSEADPWTTTTRANGHWNQIDTTSPTLSTSHSGSNSPVRHRGSIQSNSAQIMSELQNSSPYFATRPIGQASAFSRNPSKSSMDPASGKFVPNLNFLSDDKENGVQYPSRYFEDGFQRTISEDTRGSRFPGQLGSGNGTHRDSSLPPSRSSEAGNNMGGNSGSQLYSQHNAFSSFSHTPRNSLSHRPSLPGRGSSSFSQTPSGIPTLSSQSQNDELVQRLSRYSLEEDAAPYNAFARGPSGNDTYSSPRQHPGMPQPRSFKLNPHSQTWNGNGNGIAGPRNTDPYAEYPEGAFVNQYQQFNNPQINMSGRSSVSPAGSDRRDLSPGYYSLAGTPPVDVDQMYRGNMRDPRSQIHATPFMDRKLPGYQTPQSAYLQPQQALFTNQYPPPYTAHAFDYPPSTAFKLPPGSPFAYGYQMSLPSAYTHMPTPPRGPRELEIGHGCRSQLLEEFRANAKNSRRYELKVGFTGAGEEEHQSHLINFRRF